MKNVIRKREINIQDYINQEHFSSRDISQFNRLFSKAIPFPCLVVDNFLREEIAVKLLKALSKEKFYPKESDLFKLSQTSDFAGTKNPVLVEFREVLSSESFVRFLGKVTGNKLVAGKIDMAGAIYSDTDFLLCHDDKLEGRRIAYIYYLSDFSISDGGSLSLFSSENSMPKKAVKKILPKFNRLAFFEVSDISFHEIEEVVSEKQRISINGWFY